MKRKSFPGDGVSGNRFPVSRIIVHGDGNKLGRDVTDQQRMKNTVFIIEALDHFGLSFNRIRGIRAEDLLAGGQALRWQAPLGLTA